MSLVLHWPQVVTLILCALTLIVGALRHNDSYVVNGWLRLGDNVVYIWLLWMGGFFS